MATTAEFLLNNNSASTTDFYGNSTAFAGECSEPLQNPWCGLFGTQQIIEVIYLGIISVVGTIGNTFLIASIIVARKIFKFGNIFVINLAIADLIITGLYTPTVIANVVESENALPMKACHVFGFIIIAACVCSMWTLAFIALNRYWAIVRRETYKLVFTRTKIYLMLAFIWIYSVAIPMPTLLGWSQLIYDYKSMVCAWDDVSSISYTLFVIGLAILVPLALTIYCYWELYRFVRAHGTKMKLTRDSSTIARTKTSDIQEKKRMQQQISLLKTLATAVIVFILCWTPYSFCILIDSGHVDPLIKKICTWLGLNNSAVNFIIYGLMNAGFRQGYTNLLSLMAYYVTCKKIKVKERRQSSISLNTSQRISVS